MMQALQIRSLYLKAFFCMTMAACSQKEEHAPPAVTASWQPNSKSTIPFRTLNNLIVVQAIINNSEPLKFILDTGAAKISIFESERTRGFDEPMPNQPKPTPTADGLNVDGLQLKIANLTLTKVRVQKMPPSYVGAKSADDIPVSGIIGYDLFNHARVEINQNQRLITLHEPLTDSLEEGWQGSALKIHSKVPYCEAEVKIRPIDDFVPVFLHFDLGMAGPLQLNPNEHSFIDMPEGSEHRIGLADGRVTKGIAGQIHTLKIFNHTLTNQPTRFASSGYPKDAGRHGKIGANELKHFDLIIDYTNGIVAARPSEKH